MSIFNRLFGKQEPKKQEQKKQEPIKSKNEPNEFVLTPIEKKNIQGMNMVFQYVKVHNREIPITGLISDLNPNFIEFDSKRPANCHPPTGSMRYTCSIEEYFQDLRSIYKYISMQPKINNDVIENALIYIVKTHISKAGRLIDTDAYTYIDQLIIVKYTLWNSFFNKELSPEECEKLWIDLRDLIFVGFMNNIFITKYEGSSGLNPTFSLVKLSDL